MGQSASTSLVNNQSISNQISNVSNENCITACNSSVSNSSILLDDSTVEGNVSVSAVCNILGSSCVLKASLSTDLHNTNKSQQTAETMQENDPFSILGSLFGMNTNNSETDNQSTTNRVSNIMNSVCQNKATTQDSGVNIQIIGSTVGGNVSIDADGSVSNTKCVIDNVARTKIVNDNSSSQKSAILQGSPLLFAIVGVVVVIVVVMIGIAIVGVAGAGALGAGAIAYGEINKSSSSTKQAAPAGGVARPPPVRAPQAYRVR